MAARSSIDVSGWMACGATLPGASWQRCRTHYAANLLAGTPKHAWGWVKALLRSVFDQPDTEAVHAQFDRILDALADKLPAVAAHLDGARADVLAFTGLPKEIWRPRSVESHCWRRPRRRRFAAIPRERRCRSATSRSPWWPPPPPIALAALYRQQRDIAGTLQHALLPEVPDVPGLEIAARYLAGVTGIEVGGDWYDVICPDKKLDRDQVGQTLHISQMSTRSVLDVMHLFI